MAFNFRKSVTFRLAQTAKVHRIRTGDHLGKVGLHAGQETVMRALGDQDGQTMSELALTLGVQPPTVTKMVSRLAAQDLLLRKVEAEDGRRARVYLTDEGRRRAAGIDKAMKRLEREALAGLDEKDRRRLRKLLRHVERNLSTTLEKQRARSKRTGGSASGSK